MISGGIEFSLLAQICLISEAKFGDDPLLLLVILRVHG